MKIPPLTVVVKRLEGRHRRVKRPLLVERNHAVLGNSNRRTNLVLTFVVIGNHRIQLIETTSQIDHDQHGVRVGRHGPRLGGGSMVPNEIGGKRRRSGCRCLEKISPSHDMYLTYLMCIRRMSHPGVLLPLKFGGADQNADNVTA